MKTNNKTVEELKRMFDKTQKEPLPPPPHFAKEDMKKEMQDIADEFRGVISFLQGILTRVEQKLK